MLAPRFIVSLAEVAEPSAVPSFERTVPLRFLGLLRFWTFEVKSQLERPTNQGDVACVPLRKNDAKFFLVYAECSLSVICVL